MLPFPRFHATVHDHNALCRADHRPRFCCFRPFSIVRSHVSRGRPWGRLQSFGGSSMRARLWSSSESERTTWPKNLRRLAMIVWVTGGWAELVLRTTWLVTWVVNGTCRMCKRHHWSNTSSRLPDFTVTFQYIWSPLSRQRLEIQTWFQWTTNRKWSKLLTLDDLELLSVQILERIVRDFADFRDNNS